LKTLKINRSDKNFNKKQSIRNIYSQRCLIAKYGHSLTSLELCNRSQTFYRID